MTKEKMLETQIAEAINDYKSHFIHSSADVDGISPAFMENLAYDSANGEKAALREMLRKHPKWNEELDAVVVEGTRDTTPSWERISSLMGELLYHVSDQVDYLDVRRAAQWFAMPDDGKNKEVCFESLNRVAPQAYKPGKKIGKILREFLIAVGVWAETGECQKIYARICDEYHKKPTFTLYISVNPAHFMTMSNPQSDDRRPAMESCHSLDGGCSYRAGTSGYARDGVTMIVFAAVSDKREALNSRKSLRQLFMYKPQNGLLIQSRLYKMGASEGDSYGGTRGEQPESKMIRDIVEGVIAECEDAPNLWKSWKYVGNEQGISCDSAYGFAGYPDWIYQEFSAIAAIRKDKAETWKNFKIGAKNLCWVCGEETDEGDILCDECSHTGVCDDCGEHCDEDDMCWVYNEYGQEVQVCRDCLDNNYRYCDECGEYHHEDNVTWIESEEIYVCESCLERHFTQCDDCGEWERDSEIYTAYDAYGDSICICESCRDNGDYVECDECGEICHVDYMHAAYKDGESVTVCEACLNGQYQECDECGEYHHEDDMQDGLCPDCHADREESASA